MENNSVIIEGFICPMCRADLESANKLLSHFQDQHSDDQDLIKTFKDLFDKAKKKILKHDTSPDHQASTSHYSSTNQSFEDVNDVKYQQEIGFITSHTEYYNDVRSKRIQKMALPINQVIIRLEKLLDNLPTDPLKRKAHEQSIVHWMNGSTVNRCPECTMSFHLARRKHHCRICGAIMCMDCSHFVNIDTARDIIDRPVEEETESVVKSEEEQLRLCIHCISILEIMQQKKSWTTENPKISLFYDKIINSRSEADELKEKYLDILFDLKEGKSNKLQDAQDIRLQILKLAEDLDCVSKAIYSLKVSEECATSNSTILKLQNNIRTAVITYLRENLANLEPLPTEEELERLQNIRRKKIMEKLQRERMEKAENNQHSTSVPTNQKSLNNSINETSVSLGSGWIPEEQKKTIVENGDPLIEQMNIIRGYIKAARVAQRLDEVQSLEENLIELKSEFWKKQHQNDISSLENLANSSSINSLEANI